MRVVGIIQARMGSRRFPGKMMARLAGYPLLWHTIVRMKRARRLDALVLTTSTDLADAVLDAFARARGLRVYRGPEDDVLARFAKAAEAEDADLIVRINGDAPLVDPALTDHLVDTLIRAEGDYAVLAPGVACFHDGVDPLSRRALDRLRRECAEDPVAREHVTGYFKAQPGFGRSVEIAVEPALRVAGPRLSVDTPADLAFFERLYWSFGAVPGALDLRKVAARHSVAGLDRAQGA